MEPNRLSHQSLNCYIIDTLFNSASTVTVNIMICFSLIAEHNNMSQPMMCLCERPFLNISLLNNLHVVNLSLHRFCIIHLEEVETFDWPGFCRNQSQKQNLKVIATEIPRTQWSVLMSLLNTLQCKHSVHGGKSRPMTSPKVKRN